MNKPGLLLLSSLLMVCGSGHADSQFKLLVLAIPNKYHYEYIPVARESLEKLGKLHSFDFTWSNRTQDFEGDLKQYAAVVFLNTPGEELNEVQRKKFEDYMRAGGNAMVVHRAMITPPKAIGLYTNMLIS